MVRGESSSRQLPLRGKGKMGKLSGMKRPRFIGVHFDAESGAWLADHAGLILGRFRTEEDASRRVRGHVAPPLAAAPPPSCPLPKIGRAHV